LGEIICFSLFFGCSDKNPLDSNNNQKDTDILNKNGFPLVVGNQWVYHLRGEETTIWFNPPDTTVTSWDVNVLWKITAMEQVLGVDAFRMETTHHIVSGPDSGRTGTMGTWFAVKGDTLLGVASGTNTGLDPITAQLNKISSVSNQDEPDEWPVNVLVFPLKVGKEWAYFRLDPTFLGKKVVEAIDEISVPAGNFEAFRIVRHFTRDESESKIIYSTNQWFSSIGVVKYTENSDYEGVRWWHDENGNIIDAKNIRTILLYTMELVSYQIKE